MNTYRHYTISVWKRKDLAIMIAGILAVGLFLGVVVSCLVVIGTAEAEGSRMNCWVICQPTDYVNVRKGPGKNREIVGYASSGMRFETDGVEKSGFIHLIGVGEYGDGWVSSGYVVFGEPEAMDRVMTIRSNGRVACRRMIGGKRRSWLRNGDTVRVYWASREWAVTDHGFVQAKYLERD